MNFPSRDVLEKLRKEYPKGARVELVKMDDVRKRNLFSTITI